MSTRDKTIRNTGIGLIFVIPILLLTYFGVISEDSFLGSFKNFLFGFAISAAIVQVYARFFMEPGVHTDR